MKPTVFNYADHERLQAELARVTAITDGIPLSRLEAICNAERNGRCVVLSDQMKPMIWDDADRNTILCPECGQDLMGAWPENEDPERRMYQCFNCGCSVDPERAVEREDALGGVEHE